MKRNVLTGLTFALLLSAGSAFAQTPAPQGATCPDGRPAPCVAAGAAQPGAVEGGASVKAKPGAEVAAPQAETPDAEPQEAAEEPQADAPQEPAAAAEQDDQAPDTEAESDAEADADANAEAEATAETNVEVNITTEQRTEITQVVREVDVEPVPVASIDIDINVGIAVPQTIVLQPLPTRIVQIVPQYEGFLFFILDDGRIIIVAPESHEIVLIITV